MVMVWHGHKHLITLYVAGQKRRTSAWLQLSHDNLVFFNIQAPGDEVCDDYLVIIYHCFPVLCHLTFHFRQVGFVEMALAPVVIQPTTSPTPAPTTSLLGSLWRGTGKALGAAKALATLVGGTERPSEDTLRKIHFKTFVTYVSLRWYDVVDKITSSQPQPPKLQQLHERRIAQLEEQARLAASSPGSAPVSVAVSQQTASQPVSTPVTLLGASTAPIPVPNSPNRPSRSITASSPAKDVVSSLRDSIRDRSQSQRSQDSGPTVQDTPL
jgi:hypothetical protein